MAIKQTIWSLDDKKELVKSSLISEKELEDLVSENIELLNEDWLYIARQVMTPYNGIIDILCIDSEGNPVVVELKKGMTPREVTSQAIDYASYIDEIDAEKLASIYLEKNNDSSSLSQAYKSKFGYDLNEDNDGISVKIVIVASEMDESTERIINYLQKYNLNINVLFFNVFEIDGKRLLSRAWMFEEDEIDHKKKNTSLNWNGEYYFSYGVDKERSWNDSIKYGFVSAGGGYWYTKTLQNLSEGDRLWINVPGTGYVGVGTVTEAAIPTHEASFTIDGKEVPFFDLLLEGNYHSELSNENQEYLVKVNWIKTVQRNEAISEYGFFGNQNTVCKPVTEKWDFTISRLKKIWSIK